jgi:hypothetical protein
MTSHLGINWNLDLPFHSMMEEAKSQSTLIFFMEFFIIASWTIWKQRNDFIFNRGVSSFLNWKRSFCNEAYLQSSRMKSELCSAFLSLLDVYR